MQFPITSSIAKNKFGWLLLVIFSGLSLGFLILFFFSKLGLTIATFCSLVIISPFLTIIVGDSKRLIWLLLCLFLPVTVDVALNHTSHVGGAAGIMISFYDIALAILYLFWFVEIISKRGKKIDLYPEISLPFIFLLILLLLSAIPAKYPEFCLYEIIEIIKMYLTFVYLANNIKTKSDVQFILIVFIISLFFEGLLGFAQHRYDMTFFPRALGGPAYIDSRVKGTWLSYNDFAWYLTYFLPIAISMAFSQIKLPYKLVCFLTLSVASASLMWTNSRAGWISFGISVLFVGISVFSKINTKRLLISTLLVIILISCLTMPLHPRLYSKIYGRFAGRDGGSAKSRIPQFEIAFNIIKDNPFFGVGINNYAEIMHRYDNTEEGLAGITRFPVHNIFLHIAAEIGIFGLFIFLWIILVIFNKGINYIIKNNDMMVYAVIGMLAGILAFLIHGIFDVASMGNKMFIFTWFFAGLIFAISRIQAENRTNA